MGIQFRSMLAGGISEMRYEPTAKRIWAVLGGETVVDSSRAVLLWEPSIPVGEGLVADIAWTYQHPRHDALKVRGLIAFFDERVDVVVDGERRERPITPWSPGRPKSLSVTPDQGDYFRSAGYVVDCETICPGTAFRRVTWFAYLDVTLRNGRWRHRKAARAPAGSRYGVRTDGAR